MGIVEAVQADAVAALQNHILGTCLQFSGAPLEGPTAQGRARNQRLHMGVAQNRRRIEPGSQVGYSKSAFTLPKASTAI